jgi:uncharacterized protein
MNIKVSEIPEEGLDLDFDRRVEVLGIQARARLTLKRTGVDVIITGQVDSHIPLECGRCLDEFKMGLTVPVELAYSKEGALEGDEADLPDEELLRVFMDDEIDLGHLVDEQVMLNVPMKPLCSEGCKGLCPRCGTDLNKGECQCPKDKGDPRLQGLRQLLDKGDKE